MLEKIFIKNYKDINNSNVRIEYGSLAGKFGLLSNLFIGLLKLIIGFISNSISIIVDAFNNITDSISSIFTIMGFTLSNKKPTKTHPYGYARYEYVCGFVISLMMFLVGAIFVKESIVKIFNNQELVITPITYIILFIGIIVKYFQMKVYYNFSKKINSNALKTCGIDTKNDIITSFGILLSMIIMDIFNINIDGYVGLFVSVIVIYSSIKAIKEILEPIIGIRPTEEQVNEIKNKILSYDSVLGIHDLVIHNYGVNNDFITVHVEVDSRMNMMDAHELVDNIEKDFKENNKDLTIHIDPVVVGDKKVDELKEKVIESIKKLDNELDIHDFRVIKDRSHIKVIFECAVPHHKEYSKEEIIKYLKKSIKDNEYKYYYVVEIENPFC